MDDDFYEQMVETIMEAISDEDNDLGYEIAVAVFPTEDTIKPNESFPAAIKTTASPGLTGQVFISYLQTNPPEDETPIWTPDQGIVH